AMPMVLTSHHAEAGSASAPILVVEDDQPLREFIQMVLGEIGLTIETAVDGRQAMERGARRRPAAVILDMMLPGLPGTAVAAYLRQVHGRSLPIVVITMRYEGAEWASQVGAVAYLHKPFTP